MDNIFSDSNLLFYCLFQESAYNLPITLKLPLPFLAAEVDNHVPWNFLRLK